MNEVTQDNLTLLKESIPFKWRVQSFSKSTATAVCVAYIDARDVMDMLDAVVGAENWQSDYKEVKGNMYAGIGIKLNNEWIWKWDVGTESSSDKEKGEASDAFKRSAVKWGIGRFLYDIPVQYVRANEKKNSNNYPHAVDENGNKIKNLSDFINQRDDIKVFQTRSKAVSEIKKSDAVENVSNVSTAKELTDFEKKSIETKLSRINDANSIRNFLASKTKELSEKGYSDFENYLNDLLNSSLSKIQAK